MAVKSADAPSGPSSNATSTQVNEKEIHTFSAGFSHFPQVQEHLDFSIYMPYFILGVLDIRSDFSSLYEPPRPLFSRMKKAAPKKGSFTI
ncbi:MAG: hypothetical protein WBZ33_06870, partial [Thermoactinomyces sp.]